MFLFWILVWPGCCLHPQPVRAIIHGTKTHKIIIILIAVKNSKANPESQITPASNSGRSGLHCQTLRTFWVTFSDPQDVLGYIVRPSGRSVLHCQTLMTFWVTLPDPQDVLGYIFRPQGLSGLHCQALRTFWVTVPDPQDVLGYIVRASGHFTLHGQTLRTFWVTLPDH
jgi:hypothetical protein